MASRRSVLAAAVCLAAPWPTLALGAQPRFQPWSRKTTVPLQLPDMDGTVWSLAAQRGKPVLLNFWASWCEPCRSEMPSLEQLALRHKDRGLQVMAVNYREATAAVRRFIDATALKLPVLQDEDGRAAKAFGVRIFPSSVAINRLGQVRFVVVGECDWGSPAASRWMDAILQ